MSRTRTRITPSQLLALLKEWRGPNSFTLKEVENQSFTGITKYSVGQFISLLHREGWLHHTRIGGIREYTAQDVATPCPCCMAADTTRDLEEEIPATIRQDIKDVLFLREKFPGTPPAKRVDELLERLTVLADVGRAIRQLG